MMKRFARTSEIQHCIQLNANHGKKKINKKLFWDTRTVNFSINLIRWWIVLKQCPNFCVIKPLIARAVKTNQLNSIIQSDKFDYRFYHLKENFFCKCCSTIKCLCQVQFQLLCTENVVICGTHRDMIKTGVK